MPTIHEVRIATNIPLKKLRLLERMQLIRFDADDALLDLEQEAMLRYFRSRGSLTTAHLVKFIERPDMLDLFPERFKGAARAQIAELESPTPAAVMWGDLSGVTAGESEALANLVAWAKSAIPDHDVTHHWLAVRLLLVVPEGQRKFEFPRLQRVLLRMRESEAFAGWFTIEQRGSRNVTVYHRPKEFDL